MTATQQLLEALRQWEQWSRLEGEAIEQDDWQRVNACQQAKVLLRERVSTLRAVSGSSAPGALPQPVRDALRRLISLERENSERLTARRSAAETNLNELEGAILNLRRVQRSYARPTASSWTSYS